MRRVPGFLEFSKDGDIEARSFVQEDYLFRFERLLSLAFPHTSDKIAFYIHSKREQINRFSISTDNGSINTRLQTTNGIIFAALRFR